MNIKNCWSKAELNILLTKTISYTPKKSIRYSLFLFALIRGPPPINLKKFRLIGGKKNGILSKKKKRF